MACFYKIRLAGGNTIDIPSISSKRNVSQYDFNESLRDYLQNLDTAEFEKFEELLNTQSRDVLTEKEVSELDGTLVGTTSADRVLKNLSNLDLSYKYSEIISRMHDIKQLSGKNNIVFISMEESIDYIYNQKTDTIFMNSLYVNIESQETILMALIERFAYLNDRNKEGVKQDESNKDDIRDLIAKGELEKLKIDPDSGLTESYIKSLFESKKNLSKLTPDFYISEHTTNKPLDIKEKFLLKAMNPSLNYEAQRQEVPIAALSPGDLVLTSFMKGMEEMGSFKIFIDYSKNANGAYVLSLMDVDQASTFPKKYIIEDNTVAARIYDRTSEVDFPHVEALKEDNLQPIVLGEDNIKLNMNGVKALLKPGYTITTKEGNKEITRTFQRMQGSTVFTRSDSAKGSALHEVIKAPLFIGIPPIVQPKLSEYTQVTPATLGLVAEGDMVNVGGALYYVAGTYRGTIVITDGNGLRVLTKDERIVEHHVQKARHAKSLSTYNKDKKKLMLEFPHNLLQSGLEHDEPELSKNVLELGEEIPNIYAGDFLRTKNNFYVVLKSGYDTVLLYDIEAGLEVLVAIKKQDLRAGTLLITNRRQDTKISDRIIAKNRYYVSNGDSGYYDNNENYNRTKVRVVRTNHRGVIQAVPEPVYQADKKRYTDVTATHTKEIYKADPNKPLYTYSKKVSKGNPITIHQSYEGLHIQNAHENFPLIFEDIIPNTFIAFGKTSSNKKALNHWIVEKNLGDKLLVSKSFDREVVPKGGGPSQTQTTTLKKYITLTEEIHDIRLPKYAEEMQKKIKNKIEAKNTNSDGEMYSFLMDALPPIKKSNTGPILAEVVSFMQKRFGISAIFVSSEEAAKISSTSKPLRAFVKNGEIYINTELASIEDPIHEYLHLVLASMKAADYDKYVELVGSVQEHPLFDKVSKAYSNEINLDRLEETFIRLFTDTMQDTIEKEGVFSSELFDNAVKDAVAEMFSLTTSLGSNDYYDILTESVGDILTEFKSELLGDQESLYNTDNGVEIIALSSTIRKLLEAGQLKENCK